MKSALRPTVAAFVLAGVLAAQPAADPETAASNPLFGSDPLLRVLATKGLISADEYLEIALGDASGQRARLTLMLHGKGLLTDADVREVMRPVTASVQPAVLMRRVPAAPLAMAPPRPPRPRRPP